MHLDSEYPQDEKTVLLDRDGLGPAQGRLTDFVSPPRFEQLQDRMIYAAAVPGGQPFKVGLNSLVAAAWGVLSEVVELKVSAGRENLQALNERLAASINRFEAHALHDGVENSQVISARYVLCSVIDEAVVTTAWGSRSDWSKISLLSRFHSETFGGEKCFQLLERLSRDPIKHVAILELIYLCLSIGFEGKYRVAERGAVQLEAVRDALYRQIRQVRGDPLAVSALPATSRQTRRRRLPIISASGFMAFAVVALLAMYSGVAWVLGQERETVLHTFQSPAPELTPTPL
ncbi:DotU family type IV/VI secretion system protein [Pseudomonas sp. MAFF 212408]|uniref:DotU family type IV/VI secretion system protein n=1 Tax=Pseudomonas kitaguniensis TaxID=2607908 RepID=A0A5N7KJ04_9PSED|nr:type IVB secretion system protein IcmH/DotU [Pseudomonas kitaguniensis]MPR01591.1 DotU family type IV/VI secretion system protein [Pseudomonas kitaguniensis]